MAVTIPITADTTGFVGGMDRMENSMNRVLRSERTVERNLVGLAQQLSTARTGTDVLAIASERLAHVFRGGLEIGVTIGLLGVAYDQVNKTADAFFELQEGIRKALAAPTEGARSIDSLIEGMKEVHKESDALNKSVSNDSFFANIQRGIMAVLSGGPQALGEQLAKENQMLNQKQGIFGGHVTENAQNDTANLEAIRDQGQGGERQVKIIENRLKYDQEITKLQDTQKALGTDKLNGLISELQKQKEISEEIIRQNDDRKDAIEFTKIHQRLAATDLEKRAAANGREVDPIDKLRMQINNIDENKKALGNNVTTNQAFEFEAEKREALEQTRKSILNHSGSFMQGIADSSASVGLGGNFSAGGFASDPKHKEQLDALKNIEDAIYKTAGKGGTMTMTQ